jgi:hypothetical protein
LAISYPLTNSQKVPLSLTAKPRPETEVALLEPQDAPPSSLVTPTMARRPESDYQVEPEEPSQETAEQ